MHKATVRHLYVIEPVDALVNALASTPVTAPVDAPVNALASTPVNVSVNAPFDSARKKSSQCKKSAFGIL